MDIDEARLAESHQSLGSCSSYSPPGGYSPYSPPGNCLLNSPNDGPSYDLGFDALPEPATLNRSAEPDDGMLRRNTHDEYDSVHLFLEQFSKRMKTQAPWIPTLHAISST